MRSTRPTTKSPDVHGHRTLADQRISTDPGCGPWTGVRAVTAPSNRRGGAHPRPENVSRKGKTCAIDSDSTARRTPPGETAPSPRPPGRTAGGLPGRHRSGRPPGGARRPRRRRAGQHLADHHLRRRWPHRHPGSATTGADRLRRQQRHRQPDRHRQREHHLPAVRGAGASFTDSAAWLIHGSGALSASTRDAVMRQLFDPVNGIGLSFTRNPMGAPIWPGPATPTTTPAAT